MNKIILYFNKIFFNSPKKEWLQFDTIFMTLGIIISVATLTVALSIFDGYQNVLKDTILSVNSHVYFFNSEDDDLKEDHNSELSEFLSEQDEVDCYSKMIINQGMVSHAGKVKGAVVRGLKWDNDKLSNSYKTYVFKGSADLKSGDSAILGYRLAKVLSLEIGDEFKIISALGSDITALGVQQKERSFKVVGLYRSGMYEYDSKYVIINYDRAADFYLMNNQFTMMEVKLKSDFIEKADYFAYKWNHELNYKYQISSWIDFNSNLFSLLKVEKWVIFIILSFLIIIASFNVVSSVTTSIIEKKQELGIMRAFGTSKKILYNIFLFRTLLIAFIAVLFGQLTGYLISKFLSWQNFFLLKGDVYFLDTIHTEFSFQSWIIILFTAMVVVLVATMVSLRNINKLKVINILRDNK